MLSQQLCPVCATPNPPAASECHGCGGPLGDPALPESQVAYEAAPRSSAAGVSPPGGAEGWPALRLTPSLAQEASTDHWAGLPRERATPPPPAEPPDWLRPRPDTLPPSHAALPPPPPPAPEKLAFHLDVDAGSALAARRVPPATPSPAPPPPAAGGGDGLSGPPRHAAGSWSHTPPEHAAAAPPAPAPSGRGWGIRESRPARGPGWLLPRERTEAAPLQPGLPAARPAAAAPAALPPAAAPSLPWGPLAEPRGKSHVGLGLATLLIVLLAFGGGLWYFTYGPAGQGTGLGGGTHAVSAPAALGGQAENTTPADQAPLQSLQSEVQSSLTSGAQTAVTQTALGLYGSAGSTGVIPDYALFVVAANRQLSSADLSSAASGIAGDWSLATSSVQTENGVSFHCGPLRNAGDFTTLCAWIDGNVLGSVFGNAAVGQPATLVAAEEARASAESPA